MTGEKDWQLKFRRILLVHQTSEPHDWLKFLGQNANDVTLVSLDNPYGTDYVQMPAECMIVDSRVEDLTGIGYIVATASSRLLPTLVFYDERPGWEVEYMRQMTTAKFVRYNPQSVYADLARFLTDTPAVDFKELFEKSPWLMHPWTVTLDQIIRANALDAYHPSQMM